MQSNSSGSDAGDSRFLRSTGTVNTLSPTSQGRFRPSHIRQRHQRAVPLYSSSIYSSSISAATTSDIDDSLLLYEDYRRRRSMPLEHGTVRPWLSAVAESINSVEPSSSIQGICVHPTTPDCNHVAYASTIRIPQVIPVPRPDEWALPPLAPRRTLRFLFVSIPEQEEQSMLADGGQGFLRRPLGVNALKYEPEQAPPRSREDVGVDSSSASSSNQLSRSDGASSLPLLALRHAKPTSYRSSINPPALRSGAEQTLASGLSSFAPPSSHLTPSESDTTSLLTPDPRISTSPTFLKTSFTSEMTNEKPFEYSGPGNASVHEAPPPELVTDIVLTLKKIISLLRILDEENTYPASHMQTVYGSNAALLWPLRKRLKRIHTPTRLGSHAPSVESGRYAPAPANGPSANEPDFMGSDHNPQAHPWTEVYDGGQWRPAEPSAHADHPSAATSTGGQDEGISREGFPIDLMDLDKPHASKPRPPQRSDPHMKPGRESSSSASMFTNAQVDINGGTFHNVALIQKPDPPAHGGGSALQRTTLGLQVLSLATHGLHSLQLNYLLGPPPAMASPSTVYVALSFPSLYNDMKIMVGPLTLWFFMKMWVQRRAIEQR